MNNNCTHLFSNVRNIYTHTINITINYISYCVNGNNSICNIGSGPVYMYCTRIDTDNGINDWWIGSCGEYNSVISQYSNQYSNT